MSQDELDSIYSMGEIDATSIVKNGNDIEAISEYFKLKTSGSRKVHGVSLDEFLAVKDDVESLELLLQWSEITYPMMTKLFQSNK